MLASIGSEEDVRSLSTTGLMSQLYLRLKKLQRHLEVLDIQEEYVKDELKNLKRELIRAQEEVKRIQSVPLVIGQFLEPIDANTGIVGSTTGTNHVVEGILDLGRSRGALDVDLGDGDAGAVVVEELLQALADFLAHLLTAEGNHLIHGGGTGDMAQGAPMLLLRSAILRVRCLRH